MDPDSDPFSPNPGPPAWSNLTSVVTSTLGPPCFSLRPQQFPTRPAEGASGHSRQFPSLCAEPAQPPSLLTPCRHSPGPSRLTRRHRRWSQPAFRPGALACPVSVSHIALLAVLPTAPRCPTPGPLHRLFPSQTAVSCIPPRGLTQMPPLREAICLKEHTNTLNKITLMR